MRRSAVERDGLKLALREEAELPAVRRPERHRRVVGAGQQPRRQESGCARRVRCRRRDPSRRTPRAAVGRNLRRVPALERRLIGREDRQHVHAADVWLRGTRSRPPRSRSPRVPRERRGPRNPLASCAAGPTAAARATRRSIAAEAGRRAPGPSVLGILREADGDETLERRRRAGHGQVVAPYARRPVTISKTMAPNAKRSARASTCVPRAARAPCTAACRGSAPGP